MANLVYGVGVNRGEYPTTKGLDIVKEYDLWHSILTRVYSESFLIKCPTYRGCSISENFKSYSYFHSWCQSQLGFKFNGWHLDKDLLIKRNKLYSENTCVFIPQEINKVLTLRQIDRGIHPVGVYLHRPTGKYRAQISLSGQRFHLGLFKSAKEAFSAYKKAKEAYLVTLAEKYKGKLDPRAYQALKSYQVEVSD